MDGKSNLGPESSAKALTTAGICETLGEQEVLSQSPSLQERDLGKEKYLALDCEMVGVGPKGTKSALARVSIVNYWDEVVLDKYVKCDEPITNYRTQWSGITPKSLINAEDFKVVQNQVIELLRGCIVIGHAITNDFQALDYFHPEEDTRDTMKLSKVTDLGANGRQKSLKALAKNVLGLTIQEGPHDSVEDAITTMRLYRKYQTEFERWVKELPDKRTKYLAIDCEMVGIKRNRGKSALARVSIVNYYGVTVYDKYVDCGKPITSFRTASTGITGQKLFDDKSFVFCFDNKPDKIAYSIKTVKAEVRELTRDHILIVKEAPPVCFRRPKKLNLCNTVHFPEFANLGKSGDPPSFQEIVENTLGVNIQEGLHDSIANADLNMKLFRKYQREFEEWMSQVNDKKTSGKVTDKQKDQETEEKDINGKEAEAPAEAICSSENVMTPLTNDVLETNLANENGDDKIVQVKGKNEQKIRNKYLAIGCEMIGTKQNGRKSALARVSIINYEGLKVYDKYVDCGRKITSFRTTGITGQKPLGGMLTLICKQNTASIKARIID